MAIKVRCGHAACAKLLRVRDQLAGKRVKCPGCGHSTRVPALGQPPAHLANAPTESDDESSEDRVLAEPAKPLLLVLAAVVGGVAPILITLSFVAQLSWWISVPAAAVLGLVAIGLWISGCPRYQCPVCRSKPVMQWEDECASCRYTRQAQDEAQAKQDLDARLDRLVCTRTGEDAVVLKFVAVWHPSEERIVVGLNGMFGSGYSPRAYQRGGAEVWGYWRMGWVAVTNRQIALAFCGTLGINQTTLEQMHADEARGTMVLDENKITTVPIAEVQAEYEERRTGWVSALKGTWGELRLLAPIRMTIWIPALADAERLLAAITGADHSGSVQRVN